MNALNKACRADVGLGRPPLSWKAPAVLLSLGAGLLGSCIQISAPSEPIVIELNINITQEVVYRLAADAGNTIEENADIF